MKEKNEAEGHGEPQLEDQKGVRFSESSVSSKDILNKDNFSISSLDSADIIFMDKEKYRDNKDNKAEIKDMVKQAFKNGTTVIPSKETETTFRVRLDYISDKKKSKTMTSEQIIDELGLESADMLTDDKKIENFIVHRAIKDTNLPKLHETDTIIFESITKDIFQTSMNAKTKHTTLKKFDRRRTHR